MKPWIKKTLIGFAGATLLVGGLTACGSRGHHDHAAGGLTGGGYPDLAVGAKVILGTAQGLGGAFTDWSPWDSAKGQRAPIDRADYGAIVILPFRGGTHAWLAVNTFFNRPEPDYAGAVTVLQGIPSGAPGPATVWSQDSPGIRGAAEPGDSFGQVIGG